MSVTGLILVLAGATCLVGAGFNWNWFMDRVSFLEQLLGSRARARLFYIVLGLGLFVLGLLALSRVVNLG